MTRQDYEAQPILDALRAVADGTASRWTADEREALLVWCHKYPHALGWAAGAFLGEHFHTGGQPKMRIVKSSPRSPS